jgi:pimeloyl-ACP methyl ester carboxylesterase
MIPALQRQITPDHDIIVFDQRGVGYSRPSLNCQELVDFKYANLDKRLTKQEESQGTAAAAAACHDRLVREGVNPAAYTSASNAADVNDIRIALGYDKVNLYGVSYGTRLALTVMRDFPTILRGVVLDSTVPVQSNLYPEVYTSAQRDFNQLFQGCAASPPCNAAYPNLESTFYTLVDKLNDSPVTVTITNPYDKKDYRVLFTGDEFVSDVFQTLYRTDLIGVLPQLIKQAADGDLAPFGRAIADQFFYDDISRGMYFSVQCSEEATFTTPAEVAAVKKTVRQEIASGLGDAEDEGFFAICAGWGAAKAPPKENEPVRSDVPTLVLSGQYDPITPPNWAHEAAETLSRGYLFEFPGTGHGVMLSDPCPLSMARAFIGDPSNAPDATCISRMHGPAWVTG